MEMCGVGEVRSDAHGEDECKGLHEEIVLRADMGNIPYGEAV